MHIAISVLIILASYILCSVTMIWFHDHIRNRTDKLWHYALFGGVFGATISVVQYALGY